MFVEIWADIACPWCYVGKRRFEAAFADFPHRDETELIWRAFELDPGAPAARGGDYVSGIGAKYGLGPDDAAAALATMTATAAGEGLEFDFGRIRSGNTFDAHRLVQLGAAHDLQEPVLERLMRAYLSEGRLLSDHATLAELGAGAGLDTTEMAEMLASDRFTAEVRHEQATAQALGIHAVPFFVIDRKLGASGAHEPAAMRELLDRGWSRHAPVEVTAWSPEQGEG